MFRRVLCALGFVLLPLHVFGQGPLLWEVHEDLEVGNVAVPQPIALSGKVALIASEVSGDESDDLVVQALRRTTGTVQWTDQDSSSGGVSYELIVSRQHTAFVAAALADAFLQRAYDVPSGTPVWETRTPSSAPGVTPYLKDLAAGSTAVVVVGYETAWGDTPFQGVTTAYDPQTGAVLWQHHIAADGVHAIPAAVALNGNRVFVAGWYRAVVAGQDRLAVAENYFASDTDTLFIRAYDARSGALAWEYCRPGALATKVAVASGQLVVAGSQDLELTIHFRTSHTATYLAAFSPRTGDPLWEGNAPSPGYFIDLAVKGLRVVGVTTNSFLNSAVQVYHGDNGTLAWEDLQGDPGTNTGTGYIGIYMKAVALNDDSVYVGGFYGVFVCCPPYMELVVRAYDGDTGALLWDDRAHGGQGPDLSATGITGLAVGKHRLFAAGSLGVRTTNPNLVIRAYDIR